MTPSPTPSPVTTPSSSSTHHEQKEDRVLPDSYIPNKDVVIIGRGKKVHSHAGNKRFQALVASTLDEYKQASHNKTDKSFILAKLLHIVRAWSLDRLGFVKQDPITGKWHSPKDSVARVTVAQAFRDALATQYSSSKRNKQRRRQIAKGYLASSSSSPTGSSSSISSSSTAGRSCADRLEIPTCTGSSGAGAGMSLKSAFYYSERAARQSEGGRPLTAQETLARIQASIANLTHDQDTEAVPMMPMSMNMNLNMNMNMPLQHSMQNMQNMQPMQNMSNMMMMMQPQQQQQQQQPFMWQHQQGQGQRQLMAAECMPMPMGMAHMHQQQQQQQQQHDVSYMFEPLPIAPDLDNVDVEPIQHGEQPMFSFDTTCSSFAASEQTSAFFLQGTI